MKRRAFITLLGGCVAARGGRAAVGDAGDRIVKQRVSRILRGRIEGISTGSAGIRLR
jgi:hypothetical protein